VRGQRDDGEEGEDPHWVAKTSTDRELHRAISIEGAIILAIFHRTIFSDERRSTVGVPIAIADPIALAR
jgi:hypothetical protein